MPNRDGSGPFGDGRPGRGLGNCSKSRNTVINSQRNSSLNSRGFANNGIALLADALKYFLTNRKNNNRR